MNPIWRGALWRAVWFAVAIGLGVAVMLLLIGCADKFECHNTITNSSNVIAVCNDPSVIETGDAIVAPRGAADVTITRDGGN
jgi:hypothetical protein